MSKRAFVWLNIGVGGDSGTHIGAERTQITFRFGLNASCGAHVLDRTVRVQHSFVTRSYERFHKQAKKHYQLRKVFLVRWLPVLTYGSQTVPRLVLLEHMY